MVNICVSGYFDPLHKGHIELFEKARALGDRLIVIINNDNQAILKKGKSYMDENERLLIIQSLKMVDEVILSIDNDKTVCKTLELIKPDIFANGGDRHNDEIPEAKVCKKYNIKIIDGLGDKIQSSSNILSRMK